MTEHGATRKPAKKVEPAQLRVVRLGHGANCSSIGSVIDTLFVGAVASGAIFAAIAAALSREPVQRELGRDPPRRPAGDSSDESDR